MTPCSVQPAAMSPAVAYRRGSSSSASRSSRRRALGPRCRGGRRSWDRLGPPSKGSLGDRQGQNRLVRRCPIRHWVFEAGNPSVRRPPSTASSLTPVSAISPDARQHHEQGLLHGDVQGGHSVEATSGRRNQGIDRESRPSNRGPSRRSDRPKAQRVGISATSQHVVAQVCSSYLGPGQRPHVTRLPRPEWVEEVCLLEGSIARPGRHNSPVFRSQ